ncbi:hypothetical protein IWQ48_005415 [Labrenzia sp. EL_13]|nr:hypothetical protein [Labrenzia sp. EL_142]MBG6165321.1 hypothetical protein [Labrenzia sp. EL_195]MBG6204252.1 hypothetical protein [Labrenzia sp. EL_13]MBG6208105.1 hypothetical protein [Labrenzia sp. EL_126]
MQTIPGQLSAIPPAACVLHQRGALETQLAIGSSVNKARLVGQSSGSKFVWKDRHQHQGAVFAPAST